MDRKDLITFLWEEYKLRQEQYWLRFNSFALAIVTINVVPYVKPELAEKLGRLVVAFPAGAFLLSIVCMWLLASEYQRLRMVRQAYDKELSEECTIPRMPKNTLWDKIVASRIGSATSILFGVGLTTVSIANLFILLSWKIDAK